MADCVSRVAVVVQPAVEIRSTIAPQSAVRASFGAAQGPAGPPGPGGASVDAMFDGVLVRVPVLPRVAVARGAALPNLGSARGLVWSTVLDGVAAWTGARGWQPLGGVVAAPPAGLRLVNAQGAALVNDAGKVIARG